MKRDLNACSLSPSLSCHVRTPQRGSQPCEKQNPPCRHPDLGFQPPELRGAHVCCLSPSVTPAAAAQADQASRLSYIITFPPLQDGFPSCRNWSTAAPPQQRLQLSLPLSSSCSHLAHSLLSFTVKPVGTVCTGGLLALLSALWHPSRGAPMPTSCPHRQRKAMLGSVLILCPFP